MSLLTDEEIERLRQECNGASYLSFARAVIAAYEKKQRDELLAALDYCKAIGSWTELHKHINGVITSVKYIRQVEEPSKTSAMKESEK